MLSRQSIQWNPPQIHKLTQPVIYQFISDALRSHVSNMYIFQTRVSRQYRQYISNESKQLQPFCSLQYMSLVQQSYANKYAANPHRLIVYIWSTFVSALVFQIIGFYQLYCKVQLVAMRLQEWQQHLMDSSIQSKMGQINSQYCQQCLNNIQTSMTPTSQSLIRVKSNINSPQQQPSQPSFIHALSLAEPDINSTNNEDIPAQSKKKQKRIMKYNNNSSRISTVLVISVMSFVLFYSYHFLSYWSISNQIKNQKKVHDQALLAHLEWLASDYAPFSSLFVEEYIYQLSKNSHWDLVIKKSESALEKSANVQKFSIYYHQALAYCFKLMFKQCKQAIQKSYRYSTRQKLPYIQNVYNILISNDFATQKQIPTGVEFESSAESVKPKQRTNSDNFESGTAVDGEYRLNQI